MRRKKILSEKRHVSRFERLSALARCAAPNI